MTISFPVPVERFGKDHWTTFAYAEACATDRRPLDRERMRVDVDRHPLLANTASASSPTKYPTRLKGVDGAIREELADHDDWDCVEDLEATGLLVLGTLMNPFVTITDRGRAVAAELRAYKQDGGGFHGFQPSAGALAVLLRPIDVRTLSIAYR